MLKYIIKRILWIIPILIGVTIVVFTILYFAPGDPAYLALGDNATPEAVEAYRIEMGINGSYWEQLGRVLLGLVQGDLGISFRSRTPVLNELLVRFSVTFNISAWSIVLGIILGIFFGIVAALKQNTILDSLCTGCALFGISMPMFWQGLMLILIFSVGLGWLPPSGYGNIEAARAIGANNWRIIVHHILPNSISSLIVQATLAMAGAIISASALSFLGFGIQAPLPEWGAMLSTGRRYIRTEPYLTVIPGLAIMVVVYALNVVGDGLRDCLDPRLKK